MVDPLALETMPLSPAACAWLKESGWVHLSFHSPMHLVDTAGAEISAEEKAVVGAEFAKRGIRFSAPVDWAAVGTEGDFFRKAIAVLAEPEAQIRISAIHPNAEPTLINLFAANGHAALTYFDTVAIHVGPAVALQDLIRALVRRLTSPPLTAQSIYLWPAQARISEILWPKTGRTALDEIPRQEALAALGEAGFAPQAAVEAIEALTVTEFAEAGSSGLRIRDPNRPWMEPIWSGHLFEIECLLLKGLEPGERAVSHRLLFAGPEGKRIRAVALAGEELRAAFGSNQPPEEELLVFSVIDGEALDAEIQEILAGVLTA